MSSQLSAAEKAELRRQKILAKKNARMAYAAGDHSRLPSDAPLERVEVTEQTPVSPNTPAHDIPRRESSAAQAAPVMQANPCDKGSPLPGILKKAWFRGFLLGIMAISFAFTVHMGVVEAWRISAVEVFACAEMCLLLPRMMMGAQSLLEQSRNSGSVMGALWVLFCAQELYRAVNGVICDFSTYMMCFLYTWYVLAN